MSSVKIPKWIGPVLCPVVLILFIAILCFYYCYWKPRREKNKGKNQAKDKQVKKKMINSPSLVQQSPRSKLIKDKNISHVDEEMSYGFGYYDCDTYTTYAPYCMDYCPLPSSGMSYCVQYEGRPRVVYCPKTSYLAKSRDAAHTAHDKSRCKPCTADKTRKCKVRCPRGECIKCPDLPMIKEGNSTLSLNCDEKEEQTGSGLICVCNDSEKEQMLVEDRENLEVKSSGTVSVQEDTSNCCRDSGFEDHYSASPPS